MGIRRKCLGKRCYLKPWEKIWGRETPRTHTLRSILAESGSGSDFFCLDGIGTSIELCKVARKMF